MILISGIGSAVGPLLGSVVMSYLGVGGLFYFMATLTALFALFALARGFGVRPPSIKHHRPFLLLQPIFAHDLEFFVQRRVIDPVIQAATSQRIG